MSSKFGKMELKYFERYWNCLYRATDLDIMEDQFTSLADIIVIVLLLIDALTLLHVTVVNVMTPSRNTMFHPGRLLIRDAHKKIKF
jgi:hypothetical protein